MTAWSFSKLNNYEICPKKHYHYDIAKDISEAPTPYRDEGDKLHAYFEARLKHGTALPLGYVQHEGLLASVAASPGKFYYEQKLAISATFRPVGYMGKNAWLRVVIDCVKINGTYAVILDWKTGKPKEDLTQLRLSAAVLFAHQPNLLTHIRSALVYVNYDKIVRDEARRENLPALWAEILPRVKKFQRAHETQEFPPVPNSLCKKYCAVVSCPFHGVGGR
jgi:CRISPR/Cas system-associated exonuclease Cas4 (RecB family)